MRTLLSLNGLIGATRVDGTFIRMDSGAVAFCRKIGIGAAARWVPQDLPVSFRTQSDVRSTTNALVARSIGGVSSANIVGDQAAIGWKGDRGSWSLEDLTKQDVLGRSQTALSLEDYNGICEYYELEG